MSIETPANFRCSFGDWPLRLCAAEQMTLRDRWGKHRDRLLLYIGLALWGVVGAALIISSTYLAPNLISEIIRDVGIALLSAAVLGHTVHFWIESTVVRDVFRAAIGHVLPPELRDEVHWISSFKFLIINCQCNIDVEEVLPDIVKLTIEIDTKLKNISTNPEKAKRIFTLDNWDVPGYLPEIVEYEYTVDGQETVKWNGSPKIHADKSIQIEMPEINVRPDQTVRTFAKGIEYRRTNDRFEEEWIYPVVKPELNIRTVSETLECAPEFGHDTDIGDT